MSSMFRKGQKAATGLGNLIGGLFIVGLVVSVPLAIVYTNASSRPIEEDKALSDVSTPNRLSEPVAFEVKYLQPIIYTGYVAAFGLGYFVCSTKQRGDRL